MKRKSIVTRCGFLVLAGIVAIGNMAPVEDVHADTTVIAGCWDI